MIIGTSGKIEASPIGAQRSRICQLIVHASRSPPGQAPKTLDFGNSLSQSEGSLVPFLPLLSIGSTLRALGVKFPFNLQKWFGPPMVHHSPKRTHFSGLIWESSFEYFWICWAMFLSIVFCFVELRGSSFHGFGFYFDTFFNLVLHLPELMVLVLFCNL